MSEMAAKFNYLKRKKAFKYGLPFLILIVGGSFALKEFTSLRYEYSKKQPVDPEEMKKFGISMKKKDEVTLESEFEKVKELDINNWEQKRGPRPWELDD